MKVKDWKSKYLKNDENAGKEINLEKKAKEEWEKNGGKEDDIDNKTAYNIFSGVNVPKEKYRGSKLPYNGDTYTHYWNSEPTEEEKKEAEKRAGFGTKDVMENGKEITKWTTKPYMKHNHKVVDKNYEWWKENDENAGKNIYGVLNHPYSGNWIKDGVVHHFWTSEPTEKQKEYAETNPAMYNKIKDSGEEIKKHHHIVYSNDEKKKIDNNSDKNIQASQENGFSKEQAEAAPNDELTKDSANADIKTDDASPKNLEEIKYGNLDAKISEDSKFDLSPEMEKWLIANGWTSPNSKDENAGKKIEYSLGVGDKELKEGLKDDAVRYHNYLYTSNEERKAMRDREKELGAKDFPEYTEDEEDENSGKLIRINDEDYDKIHYHWKTKPSEKQMENAEKEYKDGGINHHTHHWEENGVKHQSSNHYTEFNPGEANETNYDKLYNKLTEHYKHKKIDKSLLGNHSIYYDNSRENPVITHRDGVSDEEVKKVRKSLKDAGFHIRAEDNDEERNTEVINHKDFKKNDLTNGKTSHKDSKKAFHFW